MSAKPSPREEARERRALSRLQLAKLNRGLTLLRRRNRFYKEKLGGIALPLKQPADLAVLPFTSKEELVRDQEQNPPCGTNLTSPLSRYTRTHATSGTSGQRLKWLDTGRSWAWVLHCWREVYRAAGVGPNDVVFAAFGFGPFLGFWAGFEAAQSLGAMVVAGGAQSSAERLDWIQDTRATVLLSTPTYALRLAEVAQAKRMDLSASPVRITIHGGEPGASIQTTRARIQEAWGARPFDHAGSTEVGPWGFECPEASGLHLLESDFIGEVLEPGGDEPVGPGATGELVLTNLGRWDMPVIRYRSGDIVRLSEEPCSCGRPYLRFPGGVVGRADDMIQVKGINVYPSAVENLIRARHEVTEFEVEVFRLREMWEMEVRVEVVPESKREAVRFELAEALATRLGLRATVKAVASGSLPRYELKSRRFKIRQG